MDKQQSVSNRSRRQKVVLLTIAGVSLATFLGLHVRPQASVPSTSSQARQKDPFPLNGTYHQGMNTTLELTADHRFTEASSTCMSRSETQGRWYWRGDHLMLQSETCSFWDGIGDGKERTYRSEEPAQELLPIAWDQRIYLLNEQDAPAFCAVARPGFHRIGSYFVRTTPHDRLPVGQPQVPARFQDFLERGEIRAKLRQVQGSTLVLEELGSPRLKLGMLLWRDTLVSLDKIRVIAIDGPHVLAKVEALERYAKPLTVGALFTTGNAKTHFPFAFAE